MRNITMKYDFDREINRKDTQSAKWGVIQDPDNPSRWHATDDYFGEDRVLPLWVADMDFPAPQPVVDALVRRAQHGIYGYTIRTDSLYDRAVVDWMKRRHGWDDRTRLDRLHARGGAGGQFSRAARLRGRVKGADSAARLLSFFQCH
jgi:bifunctional pyridoxal-dependent enzyme with beta-cystathionase and maltose regulon repressor activities